MEHTLSDDINFTVIPKNHKFNPKTVGIDIIFSIRAS